MPPFQNGDAAIFELRTATPITLRGQSQQHAFEIASPDFYYQSKSTTSDEWITLSAEAGSVLEPPDTVQIGRAGRSTLRMQMAPELLLPGPQQQPYRVCIRHGTDSDICSQPFTRYDLKHTFNATPV